MSKPLPGAEAQLDAILAAIKAKAMAALLAENRREVHAVVVTEAGRVVAGRNGSHLVTKDFPLDGESTS